MACQSENLSTYLQIFTYQNRVDGIDVIFIKLLSCSFVLTKSLFKYTLLKKISLNTFFLFRQMVFKSSSICISKTCKSLICL